MGIKSDCFGLAPVEKRIQRAVRPCRVQRGTFGLLVVPTLDDGLAGFLQIGINVYRLAGGDPELPEHDSDSCKESTYRTVLLEFEGCDAIGGYFRIIAFLSVEQ